MRQVFSQGKQGFAALNRVDLSVPKGQFLSIIGPSGCGKTTLLRILGGLLEPTEGSVTIEGEPAREAQKRRAVGYIFQEAALAPWRTVEENIRLPLEIGVNGIEHSAEEVERLLGLTGLANFRSYYPYQLSGGMQQRVALARALAFNPSILLMDEPFGSLDEMTREVMGYELLRLWESTDKTVVFVTHSIPEAVRLSDRVIVMSGVNRDISGEVTVQLPRPRPEDLEEGDDFREYCGELRDLLRRE